MRAYIRLMDGVTHWLGVLAAWALLAACVISGGNAVVRYCFNLGSNAWLEAQWYLFALAVFAGAPLLLKLNEHVRVDVIYGGRSPRTKAWIDALGLLFVLLPVCLLVIHLSLPFAQDSWHQQEHSASAGGLLRWPVKAVIPLGFALLALQGLAELFKRVNYLRGQGDVNTKYERPLQ